MFIFLSKDELPESNNARYDPRLLASLPLESLLDRCQPTSGPSAEEYHVLVKKGMRKVNFYFGDVIVLAHIVDPVNGIFDDNVCKIA